jgi:hypothetical protein
LHPKESEDYLDQAWAKRPQNAFFAQGLVSWVLEILS